MKPTTLLFLVFFTFGITSAQNVGIGVENPEYKLDVDGAIRGSILYLYDGGSTADFLIRDSSAGEIGFRKGHGAQAINYIIATQGAYPNPESGNYFDITIMGEIKLYAGTVLPNGWEYCHGQVMNIGSNTALFGLIGFAYGGNGTSTFALPDLRGAAPVSAGTSLSGYTWDLGEKSY